MSRLSAGRVSARSARSNRSQSRNELWFVFELAKSLNLSGAYTNNPPPPPSLNPRHRPPPRAQTGPAVRPDNPRDPLVLPAGTLSTTPSKPRDKELVKEVMELEIALAAKQAALEECGLLIDNAVEELTSMSAAGDRFWRDVRVLKHGGRNGRDQWAIVPKPDFGGNAVGQKAKDVIIPYAIDEGESSHAWNREQSGTDRSVLRDAREMSRRVRP